MISKVPFFVVFQAAERRLWDKVEGRLSERDLYKVFDENQADKFVIKSKEATKGNVDLSWVGIFTFPSFLKLARHYGSIDLSDYQIRLLKDVRNNVAHSDKLLVTRYEDVASLAEAHKVIQEIIDN